MTHYTHYSLFAEDGRTIADFASIDEAGGLPALFADLHARQAQEPRNCVGTGGQVGTLHPGGGQVSLYVGSYMLILMTREAVQGQAVELASEGNSMSAAAATEALRE